MNRTSWRAAWFCASCGIEMTWNVQMNSHGVCQRCGASSGHTIVDCIEISKRAVWPKWRPWKYYWEFAEEPPPLKPVEDA
jgi:hypothetical protein